jgi:LysM repeat protein
VRKVTTRMRSILAVSLVLNVVLTAAVLTWFTRTTPSSPRLPRTVAAATTSSVVRLVKTNVLVRPRAFTWQEVESPDYATYVQNLRELGMPESTIRDIIIADVNQLFRQRQIDQESQQDFEWWRATPSPEVQSNLTARAQALEGERVALLEKLLGPNWSEGREPAATPLALNGPVLGALPEETKATVQGIAARSRERVAAYVAARDAANQPVSDVDLARIREETRQQLAAVLNPQQLEEFLLRYSNTADRLRSELAGLNVSPEEFRAAFRAVDSIDRDMALRFGGDDEGAVRIRQALEQQRLLALRNALGPQRFAAYQTLRDPAYREALTVAEQVGGNEETALALYEIQRATADEISRIRSDPNMTEVEKQQQIRATELEQLRARSLALGEAPPAEAPIAEQSRPHVMQPFETLGQLSVRYGVRLSALREANPGVDINRLRPGAVINIPPPAQAPTPPPLPPGLAPRR